MEKKPTHKPGKPYPRRDFRREKEDEHRINTRITAAEVRLVGDNVEQGVYPTAVALKMAQEQEIDLVEISPNATPPVCRVIDYKKFLYDQKSQCYR
jgi:translation initiation factor IF-3